MFFLKYIFHSNKIYDKLSLEKSKTFRIIPWVHFQVTRYGTVTSFFQTPWQEEEVFGNTKTQSITEIWRGDEIKSFRKNILEGKIDKRCESCFSPEKSGFTSLRKITNNKYQHKKELVLSTSRQRDIGKVMPVYFDFRFSNVCNLRCRICGAWSSSSWFNDALKLGMIKEEVKPLTYSFENTDLFFEQFKETLPYLEELYFAGGEPITMEEHYKILHLLIEHNRTDVRLTYNTNFSSFAFKQHNVFELWKKFKTISIAASLDASEKRGEFLRKNIKWTEVVNNRNLILKELPHIEFVVSATLNIYNVMHLPDFHKDWTDKKLIQVEDFIPTLLVSPKELSLEILPYSFKQKAAKKYESHLNWIHSVESPNIEKRAYMITQFENIIKVLNSNNEKGRIELFGKNSEALDKIRDEKTVDVFPELLELFQ